MNDILFDQFLDKFIKILFDLANEIIITALYPWQWQYDGGDERKVRIDADFHQILRL